MLNWLRNLREVVRTLLTLRHYIPLGPWRLLALVATMLLTTTFEVLGVGLVAQLLNLILGTPSGGGRPVAFVLRLVPGASRVELAVMFAAAVTIAMALKNGSGFTNAALLARVGRDGVVRLRGALFDRLQSAPLEIYEQHSVAALTNLFLGEVRRAMDCLSGVAGLVQICAIAGVFFAGLVWISPFMALATLAAGGVVAMLVGRLYGQFGELGRQFTTSNMRLAHSAAEAFSGVRVVRATNSQEIMAERFAQTSGAQARTEETYLRANSAMLPIVETVSVLMAMTLLVGAYSLLVAPGYLTQDKLTAYGLILLRLVPLVNRFYGTQAQLLYLSGGAREVARWLETAEFPKRAFGSQRFERVDQCIAVRNLSYSYRPGRPALDRVSFEIPAGATVALVGRSGSGKTTLATLLMRLREPSGGGVFVDGKDFWTFSPESWHEHVALVEQDPFLFNDTLGANVAFGWERATAAEIEFALHVAHLDDFLDSLPDRLATQIGERGVMLSGGQRQRLAIARAIVRNPRLLILDEATSHLDTVSEELVQAALVSATRGRTTLVIAHRLSTVRRADRIVVFQDTHIAEMGTWDTLASANGVFTDLLRSGFGAEPTTPPPFYERRHALDAVVEVPVPGAPGIPGIPGVPRTPGAPGIPVIAGIPAIPASHDPTSRR